MSTIFDTLNIARSGLRTHHTWVDTIADNIANLNTVRPTDEPAFRARYVEAVSLNERRDGIGTGGGVGVNRIVTGDPEGILSYEPDHPLADEEGYVRRPRIDMGAQMTALILAQRAYQANIGVVERVTDAYRSALTIGQGVR